jgi:hypothetical protein
VVLVVIAAAAVAAVTMYRDRALRRSSDEFVQRYGG